MCHYQLIKISFIQNCILKILETSSNTSKKTITSSATTPSTSTAFLRNATSEINNSTVNSAVTNSNISPINTQTQNATFFNSSQIFHQSSESPNSTLAHSISCLSSTNISNITSITNSTQLTTSTTHLEQTEMAENASYIETPTSIDIQKYSFGNLQSASMSIENKTSETLLDIYNKDTQVNQSTQSNGAMITTKYDAILYTKSLSPTLKRRKVMFNSSGVTSSIQLKDSNISITESNSTKSHDVVSSSIQKHSTNQSYYDTTKSEEQYNNLVTFTTESNPRDTDTNKLKGILS